MKKGMILIGTLLVFSYLIIFCACGSVKMGTVVYQEDTLNLLKNVVNEQAGNQCKGFADSDIFINGTSIDSPYFALTLTSMKTLQNIADSMGPNGRGGFITAIQIKYGIKIGTTDSMDYYIRPLYLQRKNLKTDSGTYSLVQKDTAANNIFYSVSLHGSIMPDINWQNTIDARNYQNLIEIRHHPKVTKPTKPNFNPAENDTGDVRSIILTIQEIDSAINSGKQKYVNLQNIAYPDTIKGLIFMKHDILLAPYPYTLLIRMLKEKKKNHPQGIFSGVFADQANMCPPECPSGNTTYLYILKGTQEKK